MKEEVLITCRGCKQKFPIGTLKFDKKGEDLVCNDCFNSSRSPTEAVKDMKNIDPKRLDKTGPRVFESSIEYLCMKCQYKFKRKKEYTIFKCPYCDSTDLKKTHCIHSQQLIDKAGDFFS